MGDKFKKSYSVAVAVIVTTVLCFMTSSAYYNGKLLIKPGFDSKLNTVIGVIDNYYYDDYDKNRAIEQAVKGYVDSLGDPYTTYMTKSEYDDFMNMVNSSYCGIGVTVQDNTDDNTILVVGVFSKSPAEEAGISAGDIITKVDGAAYKGEQLEEATSHIQGEEGTDVVITILQKSTGKEVDLTVTRRNIEVDSVASEVIEDNIGYIAISQFASNTAKEFETQLKELESKNIKGLIVDVRDNGGGITDAVESVAECLLPKGKTIYYTADKDGKKRYAVSKKDGTDIPLVVLANGNSASASEILIGAVKDNGRGKIVGEKSYGKGVVQQLMTMTDGTAIKVTIEKYFTPNGDYIHQKGIEPDYEVIITETDTTDTQLEKAVELLK